MTCADQPLLDLSLSAETDDDQLSEANNHDADQYAGSMPLNESVSHNESEKSSNKEIMEASTEAKVGTSSGHSAPSSPCVSRKAVSALNVDSKIPRPSTLLPSPTPLRRSGSLRIRGEKLGFTHPRLSPGRGTVHLTPRTLPASTFPSITEACESWKTSLRGGGDGLSNSTLHRHSHHRSLQSLSTLHSSKDGYPHTPTPSPEDLDLVRPHNLNRFLLDHSKEFSSDQDDLDSLRSYGSNCSTQSACDHSQFARNGTTFSGRRMKYIVHCSSHPEPDEYLTPTQRANQQIRRLKALVEQARKDLETKDENIFRLTKEVVELRLLRDEVDSSPTKTPRGPEDSPINKVVTQLENECGNSTSLSDSGHFDDVLSLTSAQSTHSPGRRQLMPTPESDRLAETYQRRIDDLTRKQGEKNLEDRKSLVDMYEKKMEDMSRKYLEKFQNEKKNLIEMYEKKMEDVARRHQEKVHEDRLSIQESYEKKIETLSLELKNRQSTGASEAQSVQSMIEKLEESQHMLAMAQENVLTLNQQLDGTNMRFSDLQQELFQARERIVILEEEVETFQKTVEMLGQQLAEKEASVAKIAQLESELLLLQTHIEDQKKTSSESKFQLESELASALNRLKDEEQKNVALQLKRTELYEEEFRTVSEVKSQLENEMARVQSCLKEEEQKRQELELWKNEVEALHNEECMQTLQNKSQLESKLESVLKSLEKEEQKNEELQKEKSEAEVAYKVEIKQADELKAQLESKLESTLKHLKEEEHNNAELQKEKAEAEAAHQTEIKQAIEQQSQLEYKLESVLKHLEEEQEKFKELLREKAETEASFQTKIKETDNLKSEIQAELERMRHLLLNEEERRRILEQSQSQETTVKEDEYRETLDFMSQLESELSMMKTRLNEEELRNNELEKWKLQAQKLEEKLGKHIQHIKNITEHSGNLENKVYELMSSLAEEREKSQKTQAQSEKVQDLEEHCQKFQREAEERLKQVQFLTNHIAVVEDEMGKLSKLVNEKKKNHEESLNLKRKNEELEEVLECSKENIPNESELHQYLSSIESEAFSGKECSTKEEQKDKEIELWKSKAKDLEEKMESLLSQINQKTQSDEFSDTAHYSLEVKEEIERLKESLDQAYWAQSEKETMRIEMETTLADQVLQVQNLQTEILTLNGHISELQRENEELVALRDLNFNSGIKTLCENGMFAECDQQKEDLCQEVNAQKKLEDIEEQHAAYLNDKQSENNAIDTVSQLKKEIETLRQALKEQEERHSEINLKMYLKGQEAAKFQRKDEVLEMAAHTPEKVSVPELLSQLAETEKELEKVKDNQLTNMPNTSLSLLSANEAVCLYLLGSFKAMYRQLAEGQANSSSSPEATLLFLKSAFYYFLTDEANCQGHLHAIQSILGFTDSEKQAIDTLTYIRR